MNELGPTPPPRHHQLGALVSAQAPPAGPRLAGEPERPSIARLSRRDRLVVLVGLTGIVDLSWAYLYVSTIEMETMMMLKIYLAFGIQLLLVDPPLSKLNAYEKLTHKPAFVQAHQSQLTDLVVLIVSVEDVEGIAIRNLDDLAGEGIGEGYGSRQQQECA